MTPLFHTVSIVGVGMMGGSLALAIKRKGLAEKVVGVGRDRRKLRETQRKGVIDEFTIHKVPSSSQLLVFATPVRVIPELLRNFLPQLRSSLLITDMGSTKAWLMGEIGKFLPPHLTFIGSHPLTGSEKQGAKFADPKIFSGNWCFITPFSEEKREKVEVIKNFWESLTLKCLILSPEEHDELVARISHLPHVLASLLAVSTEEKFLPFAGRGYRDTTRIAEGSVEMWRDILITNQENILTSMDSFERKWQEMKEALKKGDIQKIEELLQEGKRKREKLSS